MRRRGESAAGSAARGRLARAQVDPAEGSYEPEEPVHLGTFLSTPTTCFCTSSRIIAQNSLFVNTYAASGTFTKMITIVTTAPTA